LSDKVEEMVQKAYVDLDKFYKIYGNDDKDPNKKIPVPAKAKPEKTSRRTKIITLTPEPEEPELEVAKSELAPEIGIELEVAKSELTPETVEPEEASVNLISFDGLASKDVIAKVLELTGEKITVCVKSKKNVLRHAGIILAQHDYKMKE